jgi:hypothetical protein
MAVKTITAWVTDTEQTVYGYAARLNAVEIIPHSTQASEVYLQIWNVANPDPGTTAPNLVLRIPTGDSQGAGADADRTTAPSGGSSRKIKYVFSGAGFIFDTAITILCTTTPSGQTAASTTSLPEQVRVFYTPLAIA